MSDNTHRGTIWLVDSTLRDGEQRADVAFSFVQRAMIALMLDYLGISEIEVGTPAAGPHEIKSIRSIRTLGLGCRLTGWCRALREDLDAAEQAQLDSVHLSLPVSPVLLNALGRTSTWAFRQLDGLLAEARGRFEFVSVGLQDASRTQLPMLVELA